MASNVYWDYIFTFYQDTWPYISMITFTHNLSHNLKWVIIYHSISFFNACGWEHTWEHCFKIIIKSEEVNIVSLIFFLLWIDKSLSVLNSQSASIPPLGIGPGRGRESP